MKAREIMTPSPHCCSPTDSLRAVASVMRDDDCGAVPVVEGGKLIGIVTDRDLAVRALASGEGPGAEVAHFMTRDPQCCNAEDDVRDVQRVMSESQVRRVPIVDASGRCIGIVSQADLARAASSSDEQVSDREVAIVVERISQPGGRGSTTRQSSGQLDRMDAQQPNQSERL
jgi:CBS domain-containing protein